MGRAGNLLDQPFQQGFDDIRRAELLDVPFSTYRCYLKSGLNRVVEILWEQEVGSSKSEPQVTKK